MNMARFPENEGGDNPGPEELVSNTGPPLPSSTLSSLLSHNGTVDLSARNTPRAVPLARDDPHQNSEENLEKHADANNDQDLCCVSERTEFVDQTGLRLGRGGLKEMVAILSVLLLKLGDMEETTV